MHDSIVFINKVQIRPHVSYRCIKMQPCRTWRPYEGPEERWCLGFWGWWHEPSPNAGCESLKKTISQIQFFYVKTSPSLYSCDMLTFVIQLEDIMKYDIKVQKDIVIPDHELEITATRAGGPGGQHVNKTDTRITIRWNVKQSTALDAQQKARILQTLKSVLTEDGDVIIHNSETRSQHKNKELALLNLAQKIRKALYVPKKRMKSAVPKSIKEARLQAKSQRSTLKKLRDKNIREE